MNWDCNDRATRIHFHHHHEHNKDKDNHADKNKKLLSLRLCIYNSSTVQITHGINYYHSRTQYQEISQVYCIHLGNYFKLKCTA